MSRRFEKSDLAALMAILAKIRLELSLMASPDNRATLLKFAAIITVMLFVSVSRPPDSRAQNEPNNNPNSYCAVCHSDTQVEFVESVHSREGFYCTDCHGGDPKSPTVQGAHSKGFRRSFSRPEIVEMCSKCHSDPTRMKPYGLPTDQHALYLTSVHGRKLQEGDSRVAICTDCHGIHRILAPTDPKSSVFRENIPGTCARCHQDQALMKSYNLPSDVVSEYRESVHGKGLLEQHSRKAPDCTSCHGTHGAAPPGVGDVATVCGQCHTQTRAAFRRSAHVGAVTQAGKAECASCHSNHRIEHANHLMWSTTCTPCHDSNSPEAERGRKIQALLTQAEAEVEKARASVEEARRVPLDVSDYEARLSDSVTYLVEARPISHDLQVDDVEDLARRSRSIALEVQSDIHQKLSVFRGRFIVIIAVWFYILVTIGVVVRYRRDLERKRQAEIAEVK